jgi:hypothetical protein
MSKWSSRKWLTTVWTEVLGIGTALGGAVYGEREVFYAGLSICVAALITYLKAEKDVDAARAGATTIIEECDCEDCQAKRHLT